MFWTVHWNNYLSVDSVDDWRGEVDDNEQTFRCDSYEAAFGYFTIVICDSDVARGWVTVHRNSDDKEGNVMLAYCNRWEDSIKLDFE